MDEERIIEGVHESIYVYMSTDRKYIHADTPECCVSWPLDSCPEIDRIVVLPMLRDGTVAKTPSGMRITWEKGLLEAFYSDEDRTTYARWPDHQAIPAMVLELMGTDLTHLEAAHQRQEEEL